MMLSKHGILCVCQWNQQILGKTPNPNNLFHLIRWDRFGSASSRLPFVSVKNEPPQGKPGWYFIRSYAAIAQLSSGFPENIFRAALRFLGFTAHPQ